MTPEISIQTVSMLSEISIQLALNSTRDFIQGSTGFKL